MKILKHHFCYYYFKINHLQTYSFLSILTAIVSLVKRRKRNGGKSWHQLCMIKQFHSSITVLKAKTFSSNYWLQQEMLLSFRKYKNKKNPYIPPHSNSNLKQNKMNSVLLLFQYQAELIITGFYSRKEYFEPYDIWHLNSSSLHFYLLIWSLITTDISPCIPHKSTQQMPSWEDKRRDRFN